MTAQSTPAIRFRKGDGGLYMVSLNGDHIGNVLQEAPGRWKAVDSHMTMSAHYKTRARAAAGLARNWRKINTEH